MTEIPEHLLKRSRDRRAALGLGGGDAGAGDAPAASESSAVAPAAAATPAPAAAAPVEPEPVEPEPIPHYVEASQRRKRIPVWAMPVLAGLIFWIPVYIGTLEQPPVEGGPLAAGGDIYATACAGCHGPAGGGATGRQLSGGEVLLTFPDWRDQVEFVELGTAGFQDQVYGDPERPGGPHVGGSFGFMPAQHISQSTGSLTRLEILEVVLYTRVELSGEPEAESELLAYLEALEASGEELPEEGDLPELELEGVAAGE